VDVALDAAEGRGDALLADVGDPHQGVQVVVVVVDEDRRTTEGSGDRSAALRPPDDRSGDVAGYPATMAVATSAAVAGTADPPVWRWTPLDLAIAGVGLGGTCLVGVGAISRPELGQPLVFLLVALAAGGGLLALASNRFEHYLLALIVSRTALDSLPGAGGGLLEPTALLGVLSVGLGLAWLWQRRRAGRLVATSRFTLALCGISGFTLISPVFAFGRIEAVQSLIRFLSFTVMYAVLEQVFRSDPSIRRLFLRGVLWSLPIPLFVAVLQLLGGGSNDGFIAVNRIRGTFSHPNPFGTHLALVAIVLVPTASRLGRLALVGTAAATAVILVFTYARGPWVAALVGAVILGVRVDRRILRAMAVGGVLIVLAVPSVATRLADLGQEETVSADADPNSLAWRVGYWEEILPYGLSSPVGGIGFGSTALVQEEGLQPHNAFVQAFVELGVPGLLTLLFALVACTNEVHRSDYWARDEWERNLAAGAAAVGVGFFLQLFSENLFVQPVSLWYFSVVIAAALANGWSDGLSPRAIRGELSIRQRLSVFLEQRRRPESDTIRELEDADIGARIRDILERNAGRQDGTSDSAGGSSGSA
jgi:putative inorganic carbon (HCO3(-)) transporter